MNLNIRGTEIMHLYRIITIESLEPIKIGSGGNKSTYSEPTKDYIPGTTIRGALIGKLVRLKFFNDKTKQDFLLGMECYNAYPYFNENYYIPAPLHMRTDKHEWRKAKAGVEKKKDFELSNMFCNDKAEKNKLEFPFVNVSGEFLKGKKIKKEYRMHHFMYKSGSEDKEKENLFRYEAICKGQDFKAIIRYDEKLEKYINVLLTGNQIVYLGGSKGSGYGKSCITSTEPINDIKGVQKELGIGFSREESRKDIFITCLSDCLFRNEFGQPINHVPEELILNGIHKTAKLEKQFIQSAKTEGYNTTWRARYPKETTIKAGSIFKYSFEEELTANEVNSLIEYLEKKPVGERTCEGYGWLGVNIKYPKKILIHEERAKKDVDLDCLLRSDKSKKVMEIIISGMDEAKERWLKMLFKQLISEKETHNTQEKIVISNALNKHQLRNMEELLKYVKTQDNEDDTSHKREDILMERHYINDKNLFSLYECNFKEIYRFINNGKINNKLKNFAELKLTSQQGKLFYYKDIDKENASKKFIKELLLASLYIERMRRA